MQKGRGDTMTHTITFGEFAKLAQRRHWTAEALAFRFRGKIEEPGEFFHRVLQGKTPGALIAYVLMALAHSVCNGVYP
jgi:hypothetical protein